MRVAILAGALLGTFLGVLICYLILKEVYVNEMEELINQSKIINHDNI